MSYESELDKTIEIVVVVKIGAEYYATKEPDSGLSVPPEYQIIKRPNLNGATVDIKNTNTPISSFNFVLDEYEFNKTSSKIMLDENQFLLKDIVIYVGHKTGSFDFSEYIEVGRTKITSVTKIANGYSVKSKEVTNLINQPALNLSGLLQTFLLSNSATLSIPDSSLWPDEGIIKINNELMYYTGKAVDGKTLLNINRGIYGTSAAEHDVGEGVFYVTYLEEVNPVDMLLQILLSKNGDGTNHAIYDVFPFGLGIAPDLIDVADFEQVRDNNFTGELHSIFIWGADNMLKFLEKSLLPSTNLRFISDNGKIAVSLLDQVDYNQDVPILDESSIKGTPTWTLTSDKIVNVIEVFFDYDAGNNKYASSLEFTDDDSINTFGRQKALKLNFPSVHSSLDGQFIAADRANRLLGRLSTARGRVALTAHLDKSLIPIGSNAQIVHRYLPQQGGTLGFSDQLEVMSKTLDLNAGLVKYKLEFTSYTGIRIPFIAPSSRIKTVLSQNSVELYDAAGYKEGFSIILFKDGDLDIDNNPTIGYYLPDAVNTIQSIVGNVVTFTNDFTTILEPEFWVKLSDYDEASEEQKARYAFIGSNTGFFNDGSKSYQIIY